MTKEEQFLFSLETQGIKLGLERTSKLLSLCALDKRGVMTCPAD